MRGWLILAVLLAGCGDAATSTPAAPDSSAAAVESPSPIASPQVLLDVTGSGIKTTQKFTAAADWDLEWSYDCTSTGSTGNFIVTVFDGDGSLSQNAGVNELDKGGSGVEHFHVGGSLYLEMNSECSWHVVAKG
jgi:hypothetical protein